MPGRLKGHSLIRKALTKGIILLILEYKERFAQVGIQ